MKKRSKIFLIISAIVFIIGVVICYFGIKTAETTGEQIFAKRVGDDRVYTYEFVEGGVDKIKIEVTDANVNIYGGSDRSYVEIVNFNENLCSYTANNAMITFRETTEIKDVAGLWESGLSFKGIRYFFTSAASDKQKTVNIYLAKDEKIKVVDVTLGKGEVAVEKVTTISDYHVNIASGKVRFTEASVESGIGVNATGDISTDVKFTNVFADTVTINAKRAKFTGEDFTTHSCDISVNMGSAKFEFIPKNPEYIIDIATRGELLVDGAIHYNEYSYPPKTDEEEQEEPVAEEEADEETDEEKPEPSSLKISGEDISVNLVTPAAAVEAPEDTQTTDTTAEQ